MSKTYQPTSAAVEIGGYDQPMTRQEWNESMDALGYTQKITTEFADGSLGYIDQRGNAVILLQPIA